MRLKYRICKKSSFIRLKFLEGKKFLAGKSITMSIMISNKNNNEVIKKCHNVQRGHHNC